MLLRIAKSNRKTAEKPEFQNLEQSMFGAKNGSTLERAVRPGNLDRRRIGADSTSGKSEPTSGIGKVRDDVEGSLESRQQQQKKYGFEFLWWWAFELRRRWA